MKKDYTLDEARAGIKSSKKPYKFMNEEFSKGGSIDEMREREFKMRVIEQLMEDKDEQLKLFLYNHWSELFPQRTDIIAKLISNGSVLGMIKASKTEYKHAQEIVNYTEGEVFDVSPEYQGTDFGQKMEQLRSILIGQGCNNVGWEIYTNKKNAKIDKVAIEIIVT